MGRWDALEKQISEEAAKNLRTEEDLYSDLLRIYKNYYMTSFGGRVEGSKPTEKKNPTQVDPEWGPLCP